MGLNNVQPRNERMWRSRKRGRMCDNRDLWSCDGHEHTSCCDYLINFTVLTLITTLYTYRYLFKKRSILKVFKAPGCNKTN